MSVPQAAYLAGVYELSRAAMAAGRRHNVIEWAISKLYSPDGGKEHGLQMSFKVGDDTEVVHYRAEEVGKGLTGAQTSTAANEAVERLIARAVQGRPGQTKTPAADMSAQAAIRTEALAIAKEVCKNYPQVRVSVVHRDWPTASFDVELWGKSRCEISTLFGYDDPSAEKIRHRIRLALDRLVQGVLDQLAP